MIERRKFFERKFGSNWKSIKDVVNNENIKFKENIDEFKIETNFSLEEKRFFLQFGIIPIYDNQKKGIATKDPSSRIPDFIHKHFNDFCIVCPNEVIENLVFEYFSAGIRITKGDNETPSSYVTRVITKMEQIGASDLTISWEKENVVLKYTLGNRNAQEYEDSIDLEFAEKVRVSLINMAYERPTEDMIDGKFFVRISGENKEYRLSVVKTILGFSIVIRSYQKFRTDMRLEDLGYRGRVLEVINDIMSDNLFGMFLVCGQPGSGKTTTIYTLLQQMKQEKYLNIKTAEDPVEIQLNGIDQCQVKKHGAPEHQITYIKLLSAFMRQHPDLIVIGELRDKNVAKVTIEASLTGNMVISTLHTGNVKATISRLTNSFDIDQSELEDVLAGVLTQRLVNKLCDCKIENNDGTFKKNDDGCEKCKSKGTPGYDGSIIAAEIASFKKGMPWNEKNPYKDYYSFEECANDLLKDGLIDIPTSKLIKSLM